jgi:hypothetical protein
MTPSLWACTAFTLASLIEMPGAFLLRRPPRSRALTGVVLAERALRRCSVVTAFPRIVPEHARRFSAHRVGRQFFPFGIEPREPFGHQLLFLFHQRSHCARLSGF